jgi:hypothetical protein
LPGQLGIDVNLIVTIVLLNDVQQTAPLLNQSFADVRIALKLNTWFFELFIKAAQFD